MEDIVSLGSIELTGFKDVDPGSMVVLKKVLGNAVRKFSGISRTFEKLYLTKKSVHESKIELKARVLDNGKVYHAETIDHNLFVGVGDIIKKLQKGYD